MKKQIIILLLLSVLLNFFFSCGNSSKKDYYSYQLIPVQIDEKWGYIDQKGKIIINPQFSEASLFSDDLALVVSSDEKVGYIDKKGRYVINPIYHSGTDFKEGLAFITPENGFPTCIDKNGDVKFILKKAEMAGNFSEGLALVKVNQKYGFVDKEGNISISPQFDYAEPFSEGLALVVIDKSDENSTKKYGFIDRSGNLVIPTQFVDALSFSNNFAAVTDGEKYGFINKNGLYIINPQYDLVHSFNEDFAAVLIGKTWGYIDKNGKIVINPQFEEVRSFHNGLAAVRSGAENWGYINKTGKYEINPQFALAGDFTPKFASVLQSDKIGFIDRKGKYMINPQFTSTYNYTNDWYLMSTMQNNYVFSDFYDVVPFLQAFLTQLEDKSFNGFGKETTLKKLINTKQYNNVKEYSEYATVVYSPFSLIDDITISKIIFYFSTPIYKMIPQYYYGYYDGEEKEYQLNAKLSNVIYYIDIEYYSDLSGKGKFLAKSLKEELEKKYHFKYISNKGVNNFSLLSDNLKIEIEYSDDDIGFSVHFLE